MLFYLKDKTKEKLCKELEKIYEKSFSMNKLGALHINYICA